MSIRSVMRPYCRLRNHRWSRTADACDRCGLTGAAYWATRPREPRDVKVEEAYFRGSEEGYIRGHRDALTEAIRVVTTTTEETT